MTDTRCFELQVLLTVTTQRLLTSARGPHDNGIGDLYELLGWMTNDSPFTHQLGRFAGECKPWLLRWFPELAIANHYLENFDELRAMERSAGAAVVKWLVMLRQREPRLRLAYDVPRIPQDDHDRIDPYDELVICSFGRGQSGMICKYGKPNMSMPYESESQ